MMSYSNDFLKVVSQVFPLGVRGQIAHVASSYSSETWFASKWNDTNLVSGGCFEDESVHAASLSEGF